MKGSGSTLRVNEQSAEYGLSQKLADWMASAPTGSIPAEVLKEAKRSVLNALATAIAGSSDVAVQRSLDVLRQFGQGNTPLIAQFPRVDAATAAFINAMAINVHDFDDTHVGTILHPTAPVASALYALASIYPMTGAEFLDAFVLGVEAECRIANAVSPEHYARGWHVTATCGVFGAATACGRILALSTDEMRWALGNSAAQAGGVVENLGTMAKSVGVGNAARNGLVSALLAKAGVEGPAFPLEGERGFLRLTGNNPRFDHLTDGFGETWELWRNTYKPYPCGVVLNPVIEAALELANRAEGSTAPVTAARVYGHSLLRERADRPDPASGREAQVSAQHAVAVCILRRSASLKDFSDEAVSSPDIARLRSLVAVETDPDLPVGAARVEIQMADGTVDILQVDQARGDLERPLSDADIEMKLAEIGSSHFDAVDLRRVTDAVWKLEDFDDMKIVTEMMRLVPHPR